MNDNQKIIYICEIYQNKRYYFRQEYLLEARRWGEPRRISEETFLKRKSEGYRVYYRQVHRLPASITRELQDIDALIDMALDIRDKEWFLELVERRKWILE